MKAAPQFKARPADTWQKFMPKKSDRHPTLPHEFNLSKPSVIKHWRSKTVAPVSCRPLIPKKKPTVPQPFNLSRKVGAAKSVSKEPVHHFKAREVPKAKPELIKPHPKSPTNAKSPKLTLVERIRNRDKFDNEVKEKEYKRTEEEAEIARAHEEQERAEVEQLRAQMVHHAEPIRNYKKLENHPSELPSTIPKSPNLNKN
jgi:hypothetical protein